MSSLTVPVTEIREIRPHPNADKLELATVLGWQVVVSKDKYKEGDKVVYFPIDAILPQELSDRFGVTNYLSSVSGQEGKFRIRRARLRGEPSFGLAVSPDEDWELGTEVQEHYGIEKYEPPVRATAGDAAPRDPLFDTYTDIENMRHYPDILVPGELVVITEKVHGCIKEDTLVMLANGEERPIKDIENGDIVLSYSNNEIVESKVVGTLIQEKTEKLDWYELEFENGRRLVCTEDHPILTTDGWIIASELNESHEVIDAYSPISSE